MNTQRRVEHLTWMFYKSLQCKEGTVFIDVEQLGLDGVTRIYEVQIDHEKLDQVDKQLRTAWKDQRGQKKFGGKKDSRALRVSAAKKAKVEVIDLT
jgi:deoxyhypusine synthase